MVVDKPEDEDRLDDGIDELSSENPLNNLHPCLKIWWISSFSNLLGGYSRPVTMGTKTLVLDHSSLSRPVRLL